MYVINKVKEPLYMIAVISNPVRYRSRYHLYKHFEKYMLDQGVILYTVEAAFGSRDFEITDKDNPCHIQLRTDHEIWHKENMINIAVSRLPRDWRMVSWVDADCTFVRPDIAQETIHQLQHYKVVQMFSHAQDVGPDYRPLQTHKGFVAQWYAHNQSVEKRNEKYDVWHSGYAWACRRDAWDEMGGLIDWAILGSADRYMACALIGDMAANLPKEFWEKCPTYTKWAMDWEARCEKHIKRNVGFVDGLLTHYFHGRKKNRFYNTRSAILWDNNFDPAFDIRRDWQGLYQLDDKKQGLRDGIRGYFRSRNEDSIDI